MVDLGHLRALLKAEQLSLFGAGRMRVTGAGGSQRPTPPASPWIRVAPFTRKGGVPVKGHLRRHVPSQGDVYAPVHQPEPPSSPPEPIPFASPDDVDDRLARDSHRGTSWDPERRAVQERASYAADLNQFYATAMGLAKTDDERAIVQAAAEAARVRYRSAFHARLGAMSNTTSWMITGPSGRNNRREQKRSDTADRRTGELLEVLPGALERIRKKLKAHRVEAAGGELAVAEAKLVHMKDQQERMKATNAIVRRKWTDEQKRAELGKVWTSPELIDTLMRQAMTPDVRMGDKVIPGRVVPPFEQWQLTNNNTNIKRQEARVAELRTRERVRDELEAATGDTSSSHEFQGSPEFPYPGTVEIDHKDQRIRLTFDKRLPREAYEAIAHRTGFKWSRKNEAFQHVLGTTGMATTKRITGLVDLPDLQAAPAPRGAWGDMLDHVQSWTPLGGGMDAAPMGVQRDRGAVGALSAWTVKRGDEYAVVWTSGGFLHGPGGVRRSSFPNPADAIMDHEAVQAVAQWGSRDDAIRELTT